MNKTDIIEALSKFISQRSGMDYRNYDSGDRLSGRESYMNDYKPILEHGKAARDMLIFVASRLQLGRGLAKRFFN